MIEIATLTKLLAWASAAPEVAKVAKWIWPKSWTNVETRFAVQEIGLGFSCDDKSWSPVGTTVRGHIFRVNVLDPDQEIIAYMEGPNSGNASPKAHINLKKFPHYLLREMFQMARCKREFERTESTDFAAKYQWHRNRVVFFWENPSEEGAKRQELEQRIIDLIAEVLVDVEKSSVTLGSRLVEDLGAEDLDLYDLTALLESEFGIELSDEDFGGETKGSFWSCCGSCVGFS